MQGDVASDGTLADNIVHFARALRTAGLKIGAASVMDAIAAVSHTGLEDRDSFRAALRATFVKRVEDLLLFEDMFQLFWISPDMARKMKALMSPLSSRVAQPEKQKAGRTRTSAALMQNRRQNPDRNDQKPNEINAEFTASDAEVLHRQDFAQMTLREEALAKQQIARLVMTGERMQTRRYQPSSKSARFDRQAMMRGFLRSGGDFLLPHYRQRRSKQRPLVVLADISGSMSQYSRLFLHFVHALTAQRRSVTTFLFGTRLTNVTRQMRFKDADVALDDCSEAVKDWSGGTRIGQTLKEFNRLWGRRVLGQGAMVLLLTDGLERDDIEGLSQEIDRLHRSCHRLIWLNPLLRYDGFEPRALGIRAMLPHVDDFKPIHNLASMADLIQALASPNPSPAIPAGPKTGGKATARKPDPLPTRMRTLV